MLSGQILLLDFQQENGFKRAYMKLYAGHLTSGG
jgi:hypothetical protein